ncbi:hypothetical protein SAMN04490244_101466 [Tranquillimonas rosea]|uniref:D-galactarate dehydratase n=1 Tax=Tranquillimonas rosea TaxID=641238 RepID=A0A1H9Q5P8_9RHOB|nr:hypothetical protein [Tranquillimonas rosea]SER55455.1 hypothetical protein SAMN04490244_101466 [Tranquillimonas rosea]
MTRVSLLALTAALASCAQVQSMFDGGESGGRPEQTAAAPAPQSSPAPTSGGNTADALDTTTDEERAAASAPPDAGESEELLGETVASLGAATEQGLWVKTPLVSTTRPGRIVYPANGKSARVELRPLGGEPGAGSQVSLGAMRTIDAPLTDLPTLRVYGL